MKVAFGPGGALEWLIAAKGRGLIDGIGLGVRQDAFLQQAIATGRIAAVLTYRDYTLADQSAADGVFPFAQQAGVGVILGSPRAGGLLTGPEPRTFAAGRAEDQHHLSRAQRAWEWARDHGIDMVALSLQFCMRHPAVATVLVGAASPEEIRRDVEAVRQPLSEDTWPAMEALQDAATRGPAATEAPPQSRRHFMAARHCSERAEPPRPQGRIQGPRRRPIPARDRSVAMRPPDGPLRLRPSRPAPSPAQPAFERSHLPPCPPPTWPLSAPPTKPRRLPGASCSGTS